MRRAASTALRLALLAGLLATSSRGLVGCGSGSSGSNGLPPSGEATWGELLALSRQQPPDPQDDDDEQEPIPVQPWVDLGPLPEARVEDPNLSTQTSGTVPPALALSNGFEAITEFVRHHGQGRPPDTHGAAGPAHLMTAVNGQVRIQDKLGGDLGAMTLADFFVRTDQRGFTDPRVVFDSLSRRWMVTAIAFPISDKSTVVLAVSTSEDPTSDLDGWRFFTLPLADPAHVLWADFDAIGVNRKWICVAANMYQIFASGVGTGFGTRMWVIDKAAALEGRLVVTDFMPGFSDTGGGGGGTMKPCVHYDAADEDLFLVDSGWGSGGRQGIRVSKLSGPVHAPVWSVVPGSLFPGSGIFLVTPNFDGGSLTLLPIAPQLGGGALLSTGDIRISSEPKCRRGRIWCALNGGLPVGLPDRTTCFWFEIDPAALPSPIVQSGTTDEGSGIFHFDPSIAVNAADDAVIGFSRSSASLHPEACARARGHLDPAGTLGPLVVLKAGEAAYVQEHVDSLGRNRWGDYSATCVDPTDDTTLWTIQEYAESFDRNTWGTWWARFSPFGPVTASCPSTLARECTRVIFPEDRLTFTFADPSGSELRATIRVDGEIEQVGITPHTDTPPTQGSMNLFVAHRHLLGEHDVSIVVESPSGGAATCTTRVTITDSEKPRITCPGDITVPATSANGASVVFATPSAYDTCDGDVSFSVTCEPPSGSTFPVGTTTVTCSAGDFFGHTSMCTFRVIVTPP